jgi:hypothetical protein
MANLQEHIEHQERLAQRLQYLINVVNALQNEDPLRHNHTINYYLRELESARFEAEHLNDIVQQIIDRATRLHKQYGENK